MKTFIITTVIIVITAFLSGEVKAGEDQYEQAAENYIENLNNGNEGVVAASLMQMVALSNYTDKYDKQMALELQDFVRQTENAELEYKAYLVLVALNNSSITESIEISEIQPEAFFTNLAETVEGKLIHDPELTTEAQLEE